MMAKKHRHAFSQTSKHPKPITPLERISHDNSGAINIPKFFESIKEAMEIFALFGYPKYLSIIVDEFSGKSDSRAISSKDKSIQHIKDFITFSQRQTGHQVKVITGDDSAEFRSKDLHDFLQQQGIVRNLTNKATPQHNSGVERYMLTYFEGIRSLLHRANLSPIFFGHAAECFGFSLDKCPTLQHNDMSREELFSGIKPSTFRLHTFGCDTYVHVQKMDRSSKTSMTGRKCIYLHPDSQREKGYVLFDPYERKLVYSCDCTFMESSFTFGRELVYIRSNIDMPITMTPSIDDETLPPLPSKDTHMESNKKVSFHPRLESQGNHANSSNRYSVLKSIIRPSSPNKHSAKQTHAHQHDDDYDFDDPNDINYQPPPVISSQIKSDTSAKEEQLLSPRRSPKKSKPMDFGPFVKSNDLDYYYYDDGEKVAFLFEQVINHDFETPFETACLIEPGPKTHAEAVNHPKEAKHWKAAIDKEMKAVIDNDSYEIVDGNVVQPNNIIEARWVFVIKIDPSTNERTYKARLVGKGFQQQEGIDYFKDMISSSMVNAKSVRLLLAITAIKGHKLHQMDAISAFTQSELKEPIYMKAPDGFGLPPNMILKLKKALYGLKQASFLWWKDLRNFIIDVCKWHVCKSDENLYFKTSKSGKLMLAATHVDDIIGSYHPSDETEYMEFVQMLASKFKMKIIGKPKSILGMRIIHDEAKRTISLDNHQYINIMLKKFNMHNCDTVFHPRLNVQFSPSDSPQTEEEKQNMGNIPYRQLIGALIYLSHTSRPDIHEPVIRLSRYMSNPGKVHWEAAKLILRYLKENRDQRLTYNGQSSMNSDTMELTAYADADHANKENNRKSIYGFIIYLNQCPISWLSKRQSIVANSTCEAEYIAISETARELKWIYQLLMEMNLNIKTPTLYGDNESSIHIASHTNIDFRIKSVDLKYHFIKDEVASGRLILRYVPSENNIADLLTKYLAKPQFYKLRNLILGKF